MIKSNTVKEIRLHTEDVNKDAQQTKEQRQGHTIRKSKSAVIPTTAAVDTNHSGKRNDAASPDCEFESEPLPWLLEVNANKIVNLFLKAKNGSTESLPI